MRVCAPVRAYVRVCMCACVLVRIYNACMIIILYYTIIYIYGRSMCVRVCTYVHAYVYAGECTYACAYAIARV